MRNEVLDRSEMKQDREGNSKKRDQDEREGANQDVGFVERKDLEPGRSAQETGRDGKVIGDQ